MTSERLEAHRVRFEQRYRELNGKGLQLNRFQAGSYKAPQVELAWQAYQWALADATQSHQQSVQPVADSDLEKLATNLELYSDYEKGRSQADFLDPVLFGRAAIALYAAVQPVEVQPVAYALKWPQDSCLNLSTGFDTMAEAVGYAESCTTAGVTVVPLYTAAPVAEERKQLRHLLDDIVEEVEDEGCAYYRIRAGRDLLFSNMVFACARLLAAAQPAESKTSYPYNNSSQR